MRASEKLVEALKIFRPHINGHNTGITLYLEALDEVIAMEHCIAKIDGVVNKIDVNLPNPTEDEDAEGLPPNYK